MQRQKCIGWANQWANQWARIRSRLVNAAPGTLHRYARPGRQLGFETLEDRRVLAITVDLLASADTGRSDNDNITQSIERGDIVFSVPGQVGNLQRLWVPGSVRSFVNGLPIPELGALASLTELRFNDLSLSGPLPDGDYHISVSAEYTVIEVSVPPAITSDLVQGTLNVTVDSIAPTGDAQLHPDSVTGFTSDVIGDPITSDRTPSFFGMGEANSIVTITINGTPAGTTVAAPLDGNSGFGQSGKDGNWRIDSVLELSDGRHEAVVTFEDVAGNRFTTAPVEFVVDSHGPRINDIRVNRSASDYDLFAPKPSDGPTPAVNSLIVEVSDLPNRAVNFAASALDAQTATERGHYRLVGDANGEIAIRSVTWTQTPALAGRPAAGNVAINFYEPLPDDRYTLLISESLVDTAGNRLDGESNARQPLEAPDFPSGDDQPGGDFVARFTIDSRAEIGVWSRGSVYLDTNGTFTSDWNNADATNRDLLLTLGYVSDHVFVGDFDGSGFDQIAAYRRHASGFEWLMTDDRFALQPPRPTNGGIGIPVSGEFNGNPLDGDEVGIFTGTHWRLDTSRPKDYQLDTTVASGMRGLPVVGNFDGFEGDDLGVYDPNANKFHLSLDSGKNGGVRNGGITTSFSLGAGLPFFGIRERPVAADMDGDGIDDLGLWVPDRNSVSPTDSAEWYFFVSGGESLAQRIQGSTMHFRPGLFGNDIFARLGDQFALPLVGNFDPPVTRTTGDTYANFADEPVAEPPLEVIASSASLEPGSEISHDENGHPSVSETVVTTEGLTQAVQAAQPTGGSPRIIATTIIETRGADGGLMESTEETSETFSELEAMTGVPSQITRVTKIHRDVDGNVRSSRESITTISVVGDQHAGTLSSTVTENAKDLDAGGGIVSSSDSRTITTQAPDPETGGAKTTAITTSLSRNAHDDVIHSSESTAVTTYATDSPGGGLRTETNTSTTTRGPNGEVVSRSEASSVTRSFADTATGVPRTVTATNEVKRDAQGAITESIELETRVEQSVDQQTGTIRSVSITRSETRDAGGNLVTVMESQVTTTQAPDPDTGMPVTRIDVNTETRDGGGDLVAAKNSTATTTQDVNPVTEELQTRTETSREEKSFDGPWRRTSQLSVTSVTIGTADQDAMDASQQEMVAAGQAASEASTFVEPLETATPGVSVVLDGSPAEESPLVLEYAWHNAGLPGDVNHDGFVTPRDALLVLAALDSGLDGSLASTRPAMDPFLDVNRDGFLSPIDAVIVIEKINRAAGMGGEGEQGDDPHLFSLPPTNTQANSLVATKVKSATADQGAGQRAIFETPFPGLPLADPSVEPSHWCGTVDWTRPPWDDLLDELAADQDVDRQLA